MRCYVRIRGIALIVFPSGKKILHPVQRLHNLRRNKNYPLFSPVHPIML